MSSVLIGVTNKHEWVYWSRYNGSFWIDYVTSVERLIVDPNDGGYGRSSYQDYTPVLTSILHRWNDD